MSVTSERRACFVECHVCGERWKVATIPMDVSAFARALRDARCPNCGNAGQKIYLCQTDGPHAVTAARDGRDVTAGGAS